MSTKPSMTQQSPAAMCVKNIAIAGKWIVDKSLSRDEIASILVEIERLRKQVEQTND